MSKLNPVVETLNQYYLPEEWKEGDKHLDVHCVIDADKIAMANAKDKITDNLVKIRITKTQYENIKEAVRKNKND